MPQLMSLISISKHTWGNIMIVCDFSIDGQQSLILKRSGKNQITITAERICHQDLRKNVVASTKIQRKTHNI